MTDEENSLKTIIDKEALARWGEALPGCSRFLDNFFTTCGYYEPEINYINYQDDLRAYSPTNKCIRQNQKRLMKAFYEITATKEADMKRKAWHYLYGR